MINSTIFRNSFFFKYYKYTNYKHTDNLQGVSLNYFAYMTKGNARLCTDTQTVNVREGDIFFIPSGCKYHSYWHGSPDIEFISLAFRFFPNFENKHYPPQVLPYTDEALPLFQSIIEQEPINARTVGQLYTLIGILMPLMSCQQSDQQDELIDRVKELIAEDPKYTVAELSKKCAVSESALYSAFKKRSDKSIQQIKKEVSMETAKTLLLSTDTPIEEISQRLGFSSGTYFRKCFKDFYGVSPRAMRARFKI